MSSEDLKRGRWRDKVGYDLYRRLVELCSLADVQKEEIYQAAKTPTIQRQAVARWNVTLGKIRQALGVSE